MLATFVEATTKGEIASLKIIASKETEHTNKAVSASKNISVTVVDYSNKASVASALKGADVVVSTFGGHGAQIPLEQILIEAGKCD